MPQSTALKYMNLALERDLDHAYITPWFYFGIVIYNLLLLTISWVVFMKQYFGNRE